MSGHLDSPDDEKALVEELRQVAQTTDGTTYANFSGMHSGSVNLMEEDSSASGPTPDSGNSEAPASDESEA
jgi:hypothetical protein